MLKVLEMLLALYLPRQKLLKFLTMTMGCLPLKSRLSFD
jgi:hypothetical protein